MPNQIPEPKLPRSLSIASFAIGLLWVLAARVGAESAAQGISRALHAELFVHLFAAIFVVILLATGFAALSRVAARNRSIRSTNALPMRDTSAREWRTGVALGWGLLLITVLPMMLTGGLHPVFWLAPRAWALSLLAALTLLVAALGTELAFRGFLFRSLIAATGPVTATILLSGIYALMTASIFTVTPFSFLASFLIGILFSLAYLRTHALWFGWGLRFGWLVSMGVLFGLPLSGAENYAGLVETQSSGPLWITGGQYGPEGALLTLPILLLGMFLLFRLTRDYAWEYTHAPIIAAGHPMNVPPPAAHAAMEASQPAPLVQILGATPAGASTIPVVVQHLEANRAAASDDVLDIHDPGDAL